MSEALAIAEWRRAEDCRQVAHLCLQHGFYPDKISWPYYAVLHGAKALLAVHGVNPRDHRGLSSLFGLHIVNTGLIEGTWGTLIGQLSAMRQDADYDIRVFSAKRTPLTLASKPTLSQIAFISCSPASSPPNDCSRRLTDAAVARLLDPAG